MARQIDAIRFVPASFDPHQGRVPGAGFGGNDYAISLSGKVFRQFRECEKAARFPNTWVVLKQPYEIEEE
jgi:hypothetical protein